MDPIMLVVTAVALGASAGLKDTATQAVKDTYSGLKALLTRRNVDVTAVEHEPNSPVKQELLLNDLHDLDDTPEAFDEELLTAAQRTVEAVAAHDTAAAEAVGVDLRGVRAAFLRIADIAAPDTGVRVRDSDVVGGIEITTVRSGSPPGPASSTKRAGGERDRPGKR